ncbi:MAG: hypothetical protein NT066_06875, partial [Candidatus Omnitrophica bacterium]|nr:hypothetical protein [Candidatus Omnitrophota bacterium]
ELFIFLVLVIAFESFVYLIPEYRLSGAPYQETQMRIKGECVDKKNNFDVIIFGDCRGWAGIRPITLEKNLPITAYNFSVDVDQTYMTSYIMLCRYLKNCVNKPKLVILQVSAISLLGRNDLNLGKLRAKVLPYFRVDSDFMKELPKGLRFKCYICRLLLSLPSLRKQFFFQEILWPIKIFQSDMGKFEKYLDSVKTEKGFYNENLDPSERRVGKINDIPEDYKKFLLSGYNLLYIEKILSLLNENRIKVIMCTTPVRNDELAIWSKYQVKDKLNSLLVPLSAKYNNLAFWDLSSIPSDVEYFADVYGGHLSCEGADILTNELARKIKETNIF